MRDPGTLEWIPVSLAISRGLYDVNKDRYFNLKTGELLSTRQALAKDMVKLGNKVSESNSLNFEKRDYFRKIPACYYGTF